MLQYLHIGKWELSCKKEYHTILDLGNSLWPSFWLPDFGKILLFIRIQVAAFFAEKDNTLIFKRKLCCILISDIHIFLFVNRSIWRQSDYIQRKESQECNNNNKCAEVSITAGYSRTWAGDEKCHKCVGLWPGNYRNGCLLYGRPNIWRRKVNDQFLLQSFSSETWLAFVSYFICITLIVTWCCEMFALMYTH